MNQLDLSKFGAAELDQLIADAAKRRAELQPPVSKEPAKTAAAYVDPAWRTHLLPDGKGHIALNIRDPGHGWIAFVIPPREIANLIKFWTFMLATAAAGEDRPTGPAAPAAGGDTVH